MLFLCCMFVLGNYYCYDIPGSLEPNIEKSFKVDPHTFGLLYTLYGAPNTIIPFVGGALLDRFGARKMLLSFTILVVIGQAICTAGGYYNSFNLMLVGRAIFGLGAESMYVG